MTLAKWTLEYFQLSEAALTDHLQSVMAAKATPSSQSGHKLTSSGQRMDKYCWVCQDSLNYETEFFCDECGRGLHHYCTKGKSLALWLKHVPKEIFQKYTIHCFVCDHLALGESKYNESELPYLNKAISKAADKLVELDEKFEKMFTLDPTALPNYQIVVAKPMWLSKIQQQAQQGKYKSPEEFFYDIKTLQHNCVVFNGPSRFVGYVKEIYESAFEEYTRILYCYECYLHDDGELQNHPSFLKPCLRPHGIVWADEGEGVYKLAKIQNYRDPNPLLALDGHSTVSLIFLDQKLCNKSNLKLAQCFIYSTYAPSCSKQISNIQEQMDNQNEANKYIENIEKEQEKLRKRTNGVANGASLDDQIKSTIWSDLLFDAPKDTKLSIDRLYLVKVSTHMSNGTGLASSSTDRTPLNTSHIVNTRKMPRPNYDERIQYFHVEEKANKHRPISTNTKAKVAFNSNGGSTGAAKSFTPTTNTNANHNSAISAKSPINMSRPSSNIAKRKHDNEILTTTIKKVKSSDKWPKRFVGLDAQQQIDPPSNNSSLLNDVQAMIQYKINAMKFAELNDPEYKDEEFDLIREMMKNLSQRVKENLMDLKSLRVCRVCFDLANIHIDMEMNVCSKRCLESLYRNSTLHRCLKHRNESPH